MQGLCSNSALFWTPKKARVRYPNLIFSPHWRSGPLGMHGLHSDSALFWIPEKVGVRYPLLFFFPCFALATSENAAVM